MGGRHRRSDRASSLQVRPIDFGGRRESAASDPALVGFARYVGRVGALAVALGIGSSAVVLPVAFADSEGSDRKSVV